MFLGEMPNDVKRKKGSKKPSQQDGGDVVGDGNEVGVTDTETREDGAMAVPEEGDTQGAGGLGLQGPITGSGEELSDTDSSVERARQRLLRLKRSKLISIVSDGDKDDGEDREKSSSKEVARRKGKSLAKKDSKEKREREKKREREAEEEEYRQ